MTTLKKRKSETLKLALPCSVLALFISFAAFATAVVKDRYLFRVAETVVGSHDIQHAEADLAAIQCRFPDTLLEPWSAETFRAKWRKVGEKLAQLDTPLAQDQNTIIFLTNIRQLWKLFVYVDGQGVSLAAELEKASLHAPGCPSVAMGNKMRDSFRKWLRVEIYLRSRYAPSGMNSSPEWREKRLQSIVQFIDSLDKQISHENFW